MDVKFVLSSIFREARRAGAEGEARCAVRLTDAVNGERGEGYWLLYDQVLVLLFRKLGDRDYCARVAPTEEWNWHTYEQEPYAFTVKLELGTEEFFCRFSPSERADGELILGVVRSAYDAAQTPVGTHQTLLAAGLELVAQLDGGKSAEQELWLEKLLSKPVRKAGALWREQHADAEWGAAAQAAFSPDQKLSFLTNALDAVMADGVWSGVEQDALRALGAELGFAGGDFDRIAELILLKNQCPLIFE